MAESIETRHENWLRVVWGLLHVREGLQGYVDTKGKDQYKVFRNNVMGRCNKQTCNQCQVNKRGKSPFRPGHFCDELNKEIQNNHVRNKPVWANTDSTKWQDQHVGHWEVTKCYLNTPGYFDKTGPNDVDASGLLSICINSSFINQHISNIQHFEEVRDIRNKTLHNAHYELDGQTADDCLDKMVSVLEDPQKLVYDTFAKQAANHIRKIKVKTEKTPAIMNEALHKWLQTNFDVKQALQEIENQMDERLRKELKFFIVEEVKREVRKSLDDRNDDARENKLKNLQEKMIYHIITNYSTIPLNPILQHQYSKLVDFYEPPKMTKTVVKKIDGILQTVQESITTIKELFISNECKDDKSPSFLKKVYILGEAGMGKTSLSQYLALAWCAVHGESEECLSMREKMKKSKLFNDIEYLKQTQLLFLLHLREFENESNCKKMLSTYLHSELGYAETHVHKLIDVINNPNAVVLIDGLDEWQCSGKQMPEFNGLPQTNIVCTSRPWKIDSCVKEPTQSYNKISITGIGFDFVEMLVINVTDCLRREGFKVRDNLTDFIKLLHSLKLKSIISMNTSVSDELLMIPVVILQLLCLWHDEKDFGRTRTQVYVNMTETLLCRMTKKQNACYSPHTCKIEVSSPLSHLFEKLDAYYCIDEIDNIEKVSRLAFTLLFTGPIENSLLFREKDLDTRHHQMFQDIKQFCLNSGIVRGTSRKSTSNQDEIYSFIHKSYQEFFAVLHIASRNCDESVQGEIAANTKSLENVDDLANVFDVVCAFDISCVESMISLIDVQTTKHAPKTDNKRKISLIKKIQEMLLATCDKYVKENISINLSNLVFDPYSYLEKIPGSQFGTFPSNILLNYPICVHIENMVITFKNLNVLCFENCSVAGPLDLSQCEMEELVLNNVKAGCIILEKVGRLKCLTFLNNGKLANGTIPFQDAINLTLLNMERINLYGPMDLSQCPLRDLELDNVQMERLTVGSLQIFERLVVVFHTEKTTCIHIHESNKAIKLTHLRMQNCSLLGPLDLSECPLKMLNLTKVKTERVIVRCVEECRVHDMSCFCDFTNAKILKYLSVNNCSVSGPLDLSECKFKRLELTKVKTERVIVRCVEECLIFDTSCSYDFTYANNLNYLTLKNCSVSGLLDLSQCFLKGLEVEEVETAKVIVGCVKTIKQIIFEFHSLTTVCIHMHKAINLNNLSMQSCFLLDPLDLLQCPLKQLKLTKVKTDRVIVGCVEHCSIYDMSSSYDFTYANNLIYLSINNCSVSGSLDLSQCPLKRLQLTNVETERVIAERVKEIERLFLEFHSLTTTCIPFNKAINLTNLSMQNCSLQDPLDLSHCPLKQLKLTNVNTERVIVRYVEACSIYDMSCSYGFLYAENLQYLTMNNCSFSDPLDLSQCALVKLDLKKVETERVIVCCVEECLVCDMSCSLDFTNANKLNFLTMKNCSISGPLDLSQCSLKMLELTKVETEKVIVGCVKTIERCILQLHSLTDMCIQINKAIKLTYLSMQNCSLLCPLDFSKCPLEQLQLLNVKTERVIVCCVIECLIHDMACSYNFTNANNIKCLTMTNCSVSGPLDLSQCPLKRLELTKVDTEKVILKINEISSNNSHTVNLKYLSMKNCSLSGPLDLSQCPLKRLYLVNVKTQMLIVGCVVNCTVSGVSCIFDYTNAKELNNLIMQDCSMSGQLDLLQSSLEKLELEEVKTDRVAVGSVKKCSLKAMSCSVDLTNANTLIELRFIDCVLTQSVNLSNCPIQSLELLNVDVTLSSFDSLQTTTKLCISDCEILSSPSLSASNCLHVVLKQCLAKNCIQYLSLTRLEIEETCDITLSIDLSNTSINQLILHEPNITASVFKRQMEHLYSLPRQITCTLDGFWGYWEGCDTGRNLLEAIEKMRTDRRFIVKVNHSAFEYVNTFSVVTNKNIPLI